MLPPPGITLSAPTVLNAGLMEATGSGTLLVSPTGQVSGGNPTVNNSGGTIVANGSGSSVLFASAAIQAGTLNTLNSGVLGTQAGATATLDGTTHGTLNNRGTYTAGNGSYTYLAGTINNTGVLQINGTANWTFVEVATGQNVTLTGGGTVSMMSAGYNVIAQQASSSGSTLTNVNNTIQGAGQIGWDSLTVVNQASGIINANVNSTSVGITINAPAVTNAGLIEATNGGQLLVSPTGQVSGGSPTVNNLGGTIVANGSGSSVQFDRATIQGGTLNTIASGTLGTLAGSTVTLNGSAQGQLTNVATYTAANASTTILTGTINNTGVLQINGTTSSTFVEMASGQSVTLTGGGKVTMSNSGNNVIAQQASNSGSTLTNVNNTIQGAGQIGWDSLTVVNQASGVINANFTSTTVGILINAPAVTNAGLIEATNGGLLLVSPTGQVSGGSPTVNNLGGTIVASGSGSSVQFDRATIQGGTLSTAGGATLGTYAGAVATLDGSTRGTLNNTGTYTAANNSTTYLAGTINNTGVLQINGVGNPTFVEVVTGQNVTLIGGGKVTMSNSGNNIIAQQASNSGSTLTNVNNTIQGAGQIGWDSLTVVNQASGVINANFTSTTVGILINAPAVTNAGLIEATNGGLLRVSPTGQVSGGSPTVNNLGGTIVANGSGSSVQFDRATIQGGTLNTLNNGVLGTLAGNSAKLDGGAHGALTNAGTYTAATSSVTILVGTINNTGTFVIIAPSGSPTWIEMASGQNVALTGKGTVMMSNSGYALIAQEASNSGSTLTNVQGAGQIGWDGLALVNNGTVLANATIGLAINGASFTNNGTVQTNSGSTLSVATGNSLMTNAGNLIVNTGSMMTVTGNYTQSAGGMQVDGAFTATAANINAGTLSGNGGIVTAPTSLTGVLRPGDSPTTAGVLNISGAYSQAAAGAYNLLVGGLSAGTQFGQVNIASTASLNGTLNASLINGFSPVAGNSFTILNSGGRTGTFAATNLPALPCGGSWQVSYTTTSAVLSVVNPVPTISSLSPSSAGAGGPAFALTVNGSGFVCGSTVIFNGNARTTTFVSPTQLTAALLASDIASAGIFNVTVTNLAPGGGTSNAVSFTVNNPVPAITTISPTSATAGGAAFTLTVNGTNFVSTSTVNFNGHARTTTFVSATRLTAAILASDIAGAGTFNLTVTNPSPGGGTSNAVSFTVFHRPSGDFDGDGKADVGVFRPSNGTWYVIPSRTPTNFMVQQWGAQGDIPVRGDYDGDGKWDFAVWRPSSGTWFIIPSSNPSALIARQWGAQGDIPVPGDYEGDGKRDVAVFRPSTGTWFMIPSSNPTSYIIQQWGTQGDIPVPGDYDGDRKTDVAVFRPSTGTWFIIPSNPSFPIVKQWGTSGDIPVPGDYDRDGKTDFAVWRPFTGTWFVIPSSNPSVPIVQQWGVSSDIPVPADYDGDGKTDFAVWRPSNGFWFIIPSSGPLTYTAKQWGTQGDVPMEKPIGQ